MTLACVVDTDVGTNVDDALALAYAATHPDIELLGVTTVSGDATARARLAASLLRVAGRPDVEVAAGASGGHPDGWSGREGEGMPDGWPRERISERRADEVLCRAGASVVALGPLTNVAVALRPGATPPARLVIMGGLFPTPHPPDLRPKRDHNLHCDPAAALAVLETDVPTLLVPCDVTFRTWLRPSHLAQLRSGGALGQLLARLIDAWIPLRRHAVAGGPSEGRVAFLHDPLAMASVLDPPFVRTERLPVSVTVREGVVTTTVDPDRGREIDVVREIDPDALADHWLATVLAGSA